MRLVTASRVQFSKVRLGAQRVATMIQAELKGHGIREAMVSEDYLTSAVFGLLKYLDSVNFWDRLFRRAVTLALDGSRASGILRLDDFGQIDEVQTFFWKRYGNAIPDLTICFLRDGDTLLKLLLEVKLYAGKGDPGDPESDQLLRYAKIADQLSTPGAPALLFFLTRCDPVPDIKESIDLLRMEHDTAARIFGIQWGDVQEACAEARDLNVSTAMERQILADLALYLSKRNLDYFTCFHRVTLHHISARPLFADVEFGQLPLSHFLKIRRLGHASQ